MQLQPEIAEIFQISNKKMCQIKWFKYENITKTNNHHNEKISTKHYLP